MSTSGKSAGAWRSRLIAATLLILLALAASPLAGDASAADRATVEHRVKDERARGYDARIKIRNEGGTKIRNWRLRFRLPHRVREVRRARLVKQRRGRVVVRAPRRNRSLGPGEVARFRYVARLEDTRVDPRGCRLNGKRCRFVSGPAGPDPDPGPGPGPDPDPGPGAPDPGVPPQAPDPGAPDPPGGSPAGRTPLSTAGDSIVDRNGSELIIQGVNWFGFETQNHVVHGLWARDYTEMLAQIRSLGFNALRIPFSLEALEASSINGVDYSRGANSRLQGKTPLEALDLIVEEAARQGLLVMLDNHSTRDDSHSDPLWFDGAYSEDQWVAAWRQLAQRYGDDPNVVAADLHNEPHGEARWGGGGANDWRRAAARAANAIGAIAPEWLIVVEGTEGGVDCQQLEGHWWGGNLEGERCSPLQIDRQQQLVFSPHEYGPGVFEQNWFKRPDYQGELLRRWSLGFDFIAERATDPSPILVGEFGGRETGTDTQEGIWQRQFMDFLSDERHSWTYWSWNPNSGDTGGVLNDDWTTVDQSKVGLLQKLQRNEPIPHPAP